LLPVLPEADPQYGESTSRGTHNPDWERDRKAHVLMYMHGTRRQHRD
jgi:hypothetical protein